MELNLKMCLAGAVVASWSRTQEVAGLSPFTAMTNIFVTEYAKFSETFGKNFITGLWRTSLQFRKIYKTMGRCTSCSIRFNV